MDQSAGTDENLSGLAPVIDRNIRVLLDRRHRAEQERGLEERLAIWIARFTGSLTFAYVHVALVGGWIAINLGWLAIPAFDPSFVGLATAASVEAIFLSTFVLITQNRMAAHAERRADLDLQINLLSEHEITHLLHLVTAIAKKLDVADTGSSEIADLKKDVAPEQVLDRIDEQEREHEEGG